MTFFTTTLVSTLTQPRCAAAEQAREIGLHAAVHDHLQAGAAGERRCRLVDDAALHPQHLGADVDGLAGERRNIAGGTEAVDDVDGFGNVIEPRVAAMPQHLLVPRIDRDDAVVVVEEGYFTEKSLGRYQLADRPTIATTRFSVTILRRVGMSPLNAGAPQACDDRNQESYAGSVRAGQSGTGAPAFPAVLRVPALVVRTHAAVNATVSV